MLTQKLTPQEQNTNTEESQDVADNPSDDKSVIEKAGGFISDVANSSAGKIIIREVTRGLLGVLGFGGTTRRTRRY
jgi:hypothetical protein